MDVLLEALSPTLELLAPYAQRIYGPKLVADIRWALARARDPLTYDCPWCGRTAGHPCEGRPEPHDGRYRVAYQSFERVVSGLT